MGILVCLGFKGLGFRVTIKVIQVEGGIVVLGVSGLRLCGLRAVGL